MVFVKKTKGWKALTECNAEQNLLSKKLIHPQKGGQCLIFWLIIFAKKIKGWIALTECNAEALVVAAHELRHLIWESHNLPNINNTGKYNSTKNIPNTGEIFPDSFMICSDFYNFCHVLLSGRARGKWSRQTCMGGRYCLNHNVDLLLVEQSNGGRY